MGVRRRRGAAASTYAPYLQAALRSPLRAVVFVVVVVALVIGIGALLGNSGGSSSNVPSAQPPGTAAPATAAPETGTAPPSVSPTPPLLTPRQASAPAPAATAASPTATAAAWTRAWLDHRAPQQWIDGLQPFTTPEYLGLLGTVDIRQLPAGTVTGPPAVVAQGTGSATISVPTSAVRLQLSLVQSDDGWRISDADQAP